MKRKNEGVEVNRPDIYECEMCWNIHGFCPLCGELVFEDDTTCNHCGAKFI